MKLQSILAGYLKLDGGAMFGVVPKTLWQRINPADEKNLCTWAMRCLLVETDGHLVLVDTGMGDKQSEKFFSFYEPQGNTVLEAVKQAGVSPSDITDVFLTHLHFDHCGGAVSKDSSGNLVPAFSNATYWSHQRHWESAISPNSREKASFLKENIIPLQESGQLKFVDNHSEIFPGFGAIVVNGHTEAQMLPVIDYKGHKVVYMADLLPSAGHIPIPYVMAYDIRPLETIVEKSEFLEEALKNDYILYFEHDREHECCTLMQTDRGIRPDQFFPVSEIG